MGGHYAPPPSPTRPVKEQLIACGKFDVTEQDGTVVATRRRLAPRRGVMRMLLPHVVVRVRPRAPGTGAIRPDALAWFMLVILFGGLVTEWTMDRAAYPREYPPSFIYGLFAVYTTLLVIEVALTRRALLVALVAARGKPQAA